VAKCYKELGILRARKKSAKYLPKDFSAYSGKVKLEGAALDYDRLLIIRLTE